MKSMASKEPRPGADIVTTPDAGTTHARIYMRVSSHAQELTRQESLIEDARRNGFYVADVYRETASGARPDRPELTRLVADLQKGDVVIAGRLDRITRLPLEAAEQLIDSIRARGARISVPGLVDLSEFAATATGVSKIVLDTMQTRLMRFALQMARDDYEVRRTRQEQGIVLAKSRGKYRGRRADVERNARIIELRATLSIAKTAKLAGCSVSHVKRVCARKNASQSPGALSISRSQSKEK